MTTDRSTVKYFKCVAVGDHLDLAKTKLLLSYTTITSSEDYVAAVFDSYVVPVIVNDEPYALQMIDITGMEDYDRLLPSKYQGANVFLVCFSVVSPESLESVKQKWVPHITHHCPKTPFLLVGLETELRDDAETLEKLMRVNERPVSVDTAEEVACELGAVKYVECSFVTQEGLKNTLDEATLAALAPAEPAGRQRWFERLMPCLFRRESDALQLEDAPPRSLEVTSIRKQPENLIFSMINFRQLELLDMIGQGGFGAVFRGKWMANEGEVVAVKKCAIAGKRRDPDIPREVLILKSLPKHPHIISFYGIAVNYPDLFVVTEFAEKGSLSNYLHKEKQVPTVDQSLAWALQVAQGMEHLHSHDIIHRDLKSANILLSEAMTTKLCDFGTARYLAETTVQTRAAGTFRWMAPEVMEAVEANINKKCDSFSYGMVVYELLVHQVPYYDTPGDGVVCMKILQGERPAIPPTIPQYLHSLLTACWDKDSHNRPTFPDIVQGLQNESF